MNNRHLKISVRMAIAMGIFLPVAETVRRIHQILAFKDFFSWFDDYTLGALIVFVAYRALKQKKNALAHLIAVWGIGAGALFNSFLGEFNYYKTANGDPGIFSTTFIVAAKGLIVLYMLTGLYQSIKANEAKAT